MRTVEWTDKRGWKHRSLVRDRDPDSAAPQGVPQDPPDLDLVDWDEIKRDIYNQLLERGLIDYQEVQRQQNSVTNIITSAIRKRIIALYKFNKEE